MDIKREDGTIHLLSFLWGNLSMSVLRPKGYLLKINGESYRILFSLKVIDELQDRTQMPMLELMGTLSNKKLKETTVRCLFKYLIEKDITIDKNKIDYYSIVLMNVFIDQLRPKKLDLIKNNNEKKTIDDEEQSDDSPMEEEIDEENLTINVERWFYRGKTVLGYPESEVWEMTLGKLITLYNEHAIYNGMIKEDKEVSIDEAIPC